MKCVVRLWPLRKRYECLKDCPQKNGNDRERRRTISYPLYSPTPVHQAALNQATLAEMQDRLREAKARLLDKGAGALTTRAARRRCAEREHPFLLARRKRRRMSGLGLRPENRRWHISRK